MSIGAIVGLSIGGLVLLLAIVFVIWIIAGYNAFIRIRNNIEEAFSTMDITMKKRFDLIPNLVETVKGFAKHESETLQKTIAARNMAMASGDVTKQLQAEGMISGALKSLFAVTENYPQLQANANFMDLQGKLQRMEDEIAASRRFYNGNVKENNTKREIFPTNLIARWFKFDKKPLYELENAEERKNVKVQF